jgi:hypothetical protein
MSGIIVSLAAFNDVQVRYVDHLVPLAILLAGFSVTAFLKVVRESRAVADCEHGRCKTVCAAQTNPESDRLTDRAIGLTDMVLTV